MKSKRPFSLSNPLFVFKNSLIDFISAKHFSLAFACREREDKPPEGFYGLFHYMISNITYLRVFYKIHPKIIKNFILQESLNFLLIKDQ